MAHDVDGGFSRCKHADRSAGVAAVLLRARHERARRKVRFAARRLADHRHGISQRSGAVGRCSKRGSPIPNHREMRVSQPRIARLDRLFENAGGASAKAIHHRRRKLTHCARDLERLRERRRIGCRRARSDRRRIIFDRVMDV